MNQRRARVWIAVALAAGAVLFCVFMFRPWWVPTTAAQRSSPLPEPKGQSALEASRPSVVPASDLALVCERFAESVRSSVATLEGEDRLDDPRIDELVALARRWIRLHIQADFEAYRGYVADLTGRDPASAGYEFTPRSAEDLEVSLQRFRVLALDEASVEIRVRYKDGRMIPMPRGGVRGARTDLKGKYSKTGDEPLLGSLAVVDAYEVRVPVEALLHGEEQRRVFLSLVCVWTPSDPRWLPWQVAVEDPSASSRASPVPWL